MERIKLREALIDFGIYIDKKDIHLENGNISENVDAYLKSINLNQSERQPVTDNKGNGNKCVCTYPLVRTSALGKDYCGKCGEDL